MLKKRYLTRYIIEDLKDKMVFISGARQVGKTTLSTELLTHYFTKSAYYNWDYREDREKILNSEWPADGDLIILDEIHKYKKWKNLIKGNYDKWKNRYKFLVTGSAKLNIFRRGGDSLQGRYHHFCLHPFSIAELTEKKISLKLTRNYMFQAHLQRMNLKRCFILADFLNLCSNKIPVIYADGIEIKLNGFLEKILEKLK